GRLRRRAPPEPRARGAGRRLDDQPGRRGVGVPPAPGVGLGRRTAHLGLAGRGRGGRGGLGGMNAVLVLIDSLNKGSLSAYRPREVQTPSIGRGASRSRACSSRSAAPTCSSTAPRTPTRSATSGTPSPGNAARCSTSCALLDEEGCPEEGYVRLGLPA